MSNNPKRFVRVTLSILLALAIALASVAAVAKDKKEEARYPDATRHAPKTDLSSQSDQKALQSAIDAVNGGDEAKAQAEAQKVLDSSRSKYAKGIALQVLANLKFNNQDYKGAIAAYKQLLDLNSVPNDTYFDSMYNMVQAYLVDGQYQAALDELKVWREQGRRDTADAYAVEGNAYYRLQKYPEAIAAMKKAIAMSDNPTNKALAHNALVIYTQANQSDKAIALLDREQKQGMITGEDDYVSSAKFYASIAQNEAKPEIALKGAQLLQQGFDKGVVKASAENYKLLGDSYMVAQKEDQALVAYGKASPLSANGDLDYMRAEILGSQTEWAQARSVLQKGIARGVTHPGKAYLLLGKLNLGNKDRAAAKAAFTKAAQEAETRDEAKAQLAKLGKAK
jgi:tetratricopeptide (TPR) repeat protein